MRNRFLIKNTSTRRYCIINGTSTSSASAAASNNASDIASSSSSSHQHQHQLSHLLHPTRKMIPYGISSSSSLRQHYNTSSGGNDQGSTRDNNNDSTFKGKIRNVFSRALDLERAMEEQQQGLHTAAKDVTATDTTPADATDDSNTNTNQESLLQQQEGDSSHTKTSSAHANDRDVPAGEFLASLERQMRQRMGISRNETSNEQSENATTKDSSSAASPNTNPSTTTKPTSSTTSHQYNFSSIQYESTLDSLRLQALRGNVDNMLLMYNFLYNHSACDRDANNHAVLMRIIFMGFFHANRSDLVEQLMMQCFEWARPASAWHSQEQEEHLEHLNEEFRQLVHDTASKSTLQAAASFPMAKFFHCVHDKIPIHTHVLDTFFDSLAAQRDLNRMQSILYWIIANASEYVELDMTSIYCSFMLAYLNRHDFDGAIEFFNTHFISELNDDSQELLQRTNEEARQLTERGKLHRARWDMEGEADFRIEPNNYLVAEPNLYAYSMLITSYISQNRIGDALKITEFLYEKKYYNLVTATQALLIQSTNLKEKKISINQLKSTWDKYFYQSKKVKTVTKADAPPVLDTNKDNEEKQSEAYESMFEAEGQVPESDAEEAKNTKCIPDSRAVTIYIMALLNAQEHGEVLKLLKTYTEIYVPDKLSLQLLVISLLRHAVYHSRLETFDEAVFIYNRYLNTTNPKLRNPLKMPMEFYENCFEVLTKLVRSNARVNVMDFMEVVLKDCLYHYDMKAIKYNMVQLIESFQLGHILDKKRRQESSDTQYSYTPPAEVIAGLPKDLQIFPGIRESEYAFSVREFVSLISLGEEIDNAPLGDQVLRFMNIIRLHRSDPSLAKLLFHYSEEHPPRDSDSYSIICGLKSLGKTQDYIISIPWTIKLVELGILKLKNPEEQSELLKEALEKWADYELAWTSLETKRTTYPLYMGTDSMSTQQMQVVSKCVRSNVNLNDQIRETDQELNAQGIGFPSQRELVQAVSLMRCAIQKEIDDGITKVLNNESLNREQQDQLIVKTLRMFCSDSNELLYRAQVMRGLQHPEEISEILLKCVCMAAPIIEQNRRARELLKQSRIALTKPVAERMKEERSKANILNPNHCPLEVRNAIYDECVMLPGSKQEQNNEAMHALCELGYTLRRTKVEAEMRKARERFRTKNRPSVVGLGVTRM